MAAAATATISLHLCSQHKQKQKQKPLDFTPSFFKPPQTLFFTPATPPHLLLLHKSTRFHPTPSFSSSSSESYLTPKGRFFTTEELKDLKVLENFSYSHESNSGSLCIRVMRQEEMDITVGLLSESFGESMSLPAQYIKFLGYLVKQYMMERRALMPHTATLVGYYRQGEEEEEERLAGTVEVSFDKKGGNASPPSPAPPRGSPYICNMTVKKPLRRRGIGWHLLKACEELISEMSSSREVYLHCRMIDAAPLKMYTKAGYSIIKTDSIWILLTLQRRKHLMCKKLPVCNNTSETDISGLDNNFNSGITLQPDVSSFSNNISESDFSGLDHNQSSNSTSESDSSNLDENSFHESQ